MEYPKYSLLVLLLIIMLKCFQKIIKIYEYLRIIKNQKPYSVSKCVPLCINNYSKKNV